MKDIDNLQEIQIPSMYLLLGNMILLESGATEAWDVLVWARRVEKGRWVFFVQVVWLVSFTVLG